MKQKILNFLNSLRFRLILLVLLAVVPALVITYISGAQQRNQAREKAIEDAYRYIRLAASYHSTLIDNTRQLLTYLAVEGSITDPQRCQEGMQKLASAYTVYHAISSVDREGMMYCSTLEIPENYSIAERDYFQNAITTKELSIGSPTVGRITSLPIIPIALPVQNGRQEVTHMVVASIQLEDILRYTLEMNLPPQSAILLVNEAGTILYRYPDTETWAGQNLPASPIIQNILTQRGEGSADVQGVDGVQRLYAFTPLQSSAQTDLYFSIGIPTEVAYANVSRLIRTNTLAILGAALLAMAAAWVVGDVLVVRIVSLTAERDRAEDELRALNTQLEMRVAKRTEELGEANDRLQVELSERQRVVEALRIRELELKKTLYLLEQSNRDLQDFAYIASHDLQEPLRKIQAFGERLVRRFNTELSPEGQDYADRMVAAASRMQSMINDLLAFSRVTTKGYQYQPTSLNKIVAEVVSDLELRIRDTRGKVIVHDLPTIDVDPLQFHQLMLNLVGNALKFHQPDVPPVVEVCTETVPTTYENHEMVMIVVKDNGIGFDVKYLDRIFQPFQRLHDRNHYEGSGIGLAICRKIVERHGGEITAKSTPNQGSRFEILLPVRQKQND